MFAKDLQTEQELKCIRINIWTSRCGTGKMYVQLKFAAWFWSTAYTTTMTNGLNLMATFTFSQLVVPAKLH